MITIETLKKFCARERWRPTISAPFSVGEWTYATDGHIGIRVPRLADVGEVDGAPKTAAEVIGAPADAEWNPMPAFDLPAYAAKSCRVCHGRGWLQRCAECEGSGEHGCEHHGCQHTHECGDCDGRGSIVGDEDTEDHDRVGCDECSGTGKTPDESRAVLSNSIMVKTTFLRMVFTLLPGPVEIATGMPTDPQRFRGLGWEAVIMPMRFDPRFTDPKINLRIDLPWVTVAEATS